MTDLPQASLARRRILLAEDEYFIVEDLRTGLERFGAAVVGPAASVADALALIAAASASGETIDAAVLDVNLRGERAYPVADALWAGGIPFVFATGYSGDMIDAAYRRAPICEKPVNMQGLGRLLAGLLDGRPAAAAASP